MDKEKTDTPRRIGFTLQGHKLIPILKYCAGPSEMSISNDQEVFNLARKK
jgi:hypothetical protein